MLKLIGGTLFTTLFAMILLAGFYALHINVYDLGWAGLTFSIMIVFWVTTIVTFLVGRAPWPVVLVIAAVLITISAVSIFLFARTYIPGLMVSPLVA